MNNFDKNPVTVQSPLSVSHIRDEKRLGPYLIVEREAEEKAHKALEENNKRQVESIRAELAQLRAAAEQAVGKQSSKS